MTDSEHVAWRLIVRTFLLISGTLLALYLVVQIIGLLVLIVLAVILATAINPLAMLVHDRRLPPGGWRIPKIAVILLLYTALLVLLGLAAALIAPTLVEQGQALVNNLPEIMGRLQQFLNNLQARFPFIPHISLSSIDIGPLLQQLFPQPTHFLGYAFTFVGALFSIILVFIMAIYFVLFGDDVIDFFVSFFPKEHRTRARQAVSEMGDRLGLWLGGQLLLSLVIFLATYIALLIFGIPFPILLAAIAGLAELIPFLGPPIGFVATAAVAVFVSPLALIEISAFYIVLQQVESNWLAPAILSRVMNVSPLVILLALLAGGALLGIIGALLSVPVAAAVYVLVIELRRPIIEETGQHK